MPTYPGMWTGGVMRAVPRGSRRTEYVAATGTPTWSDVASFNYPSPDLDAPAYDDYGLMFGWDRLRAIVNTCG